MGVVVVSEGSVVYLAIFAGFLVAMLGLGIWVARRVSTGEDFIMGGRSLGTPLLLGTTLATLVGTGSSLGVVIAVSANELPFDTPVEVKLIVEVG
jgi:Na+/proline symporter